MLLCRVFIPSKLLSLKHIGYILICHIYKTKQNKEIEESKEVPRGTLLQAPTPQSPSGTVFRHWPDNEVVWRKTAVFLCILAMDIPLPISKHMLITYFPIFFRTSSLLKREQVCLQHEGPQLPADTRTPSKGSNWLQGGTISKYDHVIEKHTFIASWPASFCFASMLILNLLNSQLSTVRTGTLIFGAKKMILERDGEMYGSLLSWYRRSWSQEEASKKHKGSFQ